MSKLFYKKKAIKFIIKPILNFCKSKNETLINFIETKKDYHMSKLDTINEKFYKVFFEQIVSCSLVDTEDFFSIRNKATDTLKNIHTPEASHLEKFEKHMIMYHVLKFLQKNAHEVDIAEINKIILTKFDFRGSDKDRFSKYFNRSQNMGDKFEPLFAADIFQNVFYINDISEQQSIYMSGFLTQCHESFINSYTTFVSLETTSNLLKYKA